MHTLPRRTALAIAFSIALGATSASAADLIAAAQPSPDAIDAARGDPARLILRAGVFDPLTQQLDLRPAGAATAATTAYAIVQFRPGQLGARKTLAHSGIEFLGYVPNNAYYVRLNGSTLERLRQDPAVRWAGPLQPALKLDPRLWQAVRANSPALQNDGRFAWPCKHRRELLVAGTIDAVMLCKGVLNVLVTWSWFAPAWM